MLYLEDYLESKYECEVDRLFCLKIIILCQFLIVANNMLLNLPNIFFNILYFTKMLAFFPLSSTKMALGLHQSIIYFFKIIH